MIHFPYILPLPNILQSITIRKTRSFSILEHVLSWNSNVIHRCQGKKTTNKIKLNDCVLCNTCHTTM